MKIFIPTFSLLIHAAFGQNGNINTNENVEGFNKFISTPNQYVLSFGNWLGKIINASLEENDRLTIEYFFKNNGEKILGKIIGKYDKTKNRFLGYQQKEHEINLGEIEFSFKENGEAHSTLSNGKKGVQMLLS